MKTDPELGARTFMGLVMVLLACLGIALIGHASDDPMTAFGYALTLFAVFYIFGLIRQHYDTVERHETSELRSQGIDRLAAAAE